MIHEPPGQHHGHELTGQCSIPAHRTMDADVGLIPRHDENRYLAIVNKEEQQRSNLLIVLRLESLFTKGWE